MAKTKLTLFIDFMRSKADEIDSTYRQCHNDVAGELRKQIKIYEAGSNKTIPNCWDAYYAEFEKNGDPEYNEFLRLKGKFEG